MKAAQHSFKVTVKGIQHNLAVKEVLVFHVCLRLSIDFSQEFI